MTPRARRTYSASFLRWHVQQERIARRLVLARFGRMAEGLLRMLENTGPQVVGATLDMTVTESAHLAMLEAIYIAIGTAAAQREYDRLLPPRKSQEQPLRTKDRDPAEYPNLLPPKPPNLIVINPFSQGWRDRMVGLARSSESAARVTQMTAHTRQLIRDVLTRGAEQNWTVRQIARRMRSALIDPVRALLIARTETTRAASAGAEAGAASTNLTLDKIWIATGDSRTRDSHRAMLSSKPVPRDGVFIVAGLPMKYPGDPAGGAANVCRCRCALVYIPHVNPLSV